MVSQLFHYTCSSLVHHWLSHFAELHQTLAGILCSSRIISQKTVSAWYGSVSVKASLKWVTQWVELTLFRDRGRIGHLWGWEYFIRVEFATVIESCSCQWLQFAVKMFHSICETITSHYFSHSLHLSTDTKWSGEEWSWFTMFGPVLENDIKLSKSGFRNLFLVVNGVDAGSSLHPALRTAARDLRNTIIHHNNVWSEPI